jgi:hypothetical protein
MTIVKKRNCEWLKKITTIDERKEILRFYNRYRWNFLDYLYTPKMTRSHLLEGLKSEPKLKTTEN